MNNDEINKAFSRWLDLTNTGPIEGLTRHWAAFKAGYKMALGAPLSTIKIKDVEFHRPWDTYPDIQIDVLGQDNLITLDQLQEVLDFFKSIS